jgi:hypothetical protein
MELKTAYIKNSIDSDRVRLVGEVSYDNKNHPLEEYWFEVPAKYASWLSLSGNAWLACLLPLACTLGETLRICAPVDRTLFENVHELMRVWKFWYPELSIVSIEAPVMDDARPQTGAKTAAFFSGGVDSFFTVLWHSDAAGSYKQPAIEELIDVWGLDVRLNKPDAYRGMRDSLGKAASELGKELIDVATNLRTTLWRSVDYGLVSHNCALAAVAHCLEKRYSKTLIASSHGYKNPFPWGSHPLTDPLLSSGRLRIVHDGASFTRVQKTERIARSEIALKSLRVCHKFGSERNCGTCNKCYRTLITLEILGVRDHCSTFPKEGFDFKRIEKIYSPTENDRFFLREVQAFAIERERHEIAAAIERSFQYSVWLERRLPLAKTIDRWLKSAPFFWRWGGTMERWCLADSVV